MLVRGYRRPGGEPLCESKPPASSIGVYGSLVRTVKGATSPLWTAADRATSYEDSRLILPRQSPYPTEGGPSVATPHQQQSGLCRSIWHVLS